jgi:hypothetical protein
MAPPVLLVAQVLHRAAEQAELHAALDQQRQVAVAERLERGDRAGEVAAAPVRLREEAARLAQLGHPAHPAQAELAILVAADLLDRGELLLAQPPAHALANLLLPAVEEAAQRLRVGPALARLIRGRRLGHRSLAHPWSRRTIARVTKR